MAESSEGYSDGVEDAPEDDDNDALVATQAAVARAAAQTWGAGEDPCYKATFPVRDRSNILMRARNVGYFGMGDLAIPGEVAKNVTFAYRHWEERRVDLVLPRAVKLGFGGDAGSSPRAISRNGRGASKISEQ